MCLSLTPRPQVRLRPMAEDFGIAEDAMQLVREAAIENNSSLEEMKREHGDKVS